MEEEAAQSTMEEEAAPVFRVCVRRKLRSQVGNGIEKPDCKN
jgi:hypothetical protein